MLAAAGLDAAAQSPFITTRQVAITAEKVAISAVMAGCLPAHMLVVVAALEGIADPRWGYHGPATSTGSAAVLVIGHRPIAQPLAFHPAAHPFPPARRANPPPQPPAALRGPRRDRQT